MDAQEQLAFELRELRRRIEILESRAFTVPFLDADPAVEEPGNLWVFNDGRVRLRMADGVTIRQIITTTGGATTSGTLKPTPPAAQQSFDETLTCEWIADFDGLGNQRGSAGDMHYGRDTATWGRQTVMMSFANFRAQLVGAEIRYAELIVNSLYTWPDAGARAFFGTHAVASLPVTYSRKSIENFSTILPQGGEKRFAVQPALIEELRDDVIDGFVIEQPDDSKTRYGYIAANVQLRVKYVK